MHRVYLMIVILCLGSFASAQAQPVSNSVPRPKLVVGIVVDQMRWDFLYRYFNRYSPTGGFRRFLDQGFSCENTFIPYAPTVTAPGHACIYTGSVPSIHAITGNAWYDNLLKKTVYCTEDSSVKGVGGTGTIGEMSPRNMLVTTICDELKLATNFTNKVIGIAIKDRGGILPAGHTANAAYWYNAGTGDWISSTFYMTDLPAWVKDFNAKKNVDKYYKQNWNTLYPIGTYLQSTKDENEYESKALGTDAKGFPYNLEKFVGKSYSAIASTPYGNSLTADMAKAAVAAEKLGEDDITDFLAVSFSSPDYIGHSFGPNSIEIEDTYLRLDKDLGDFFNYLDSKIGKGEYLVFFTADHGVSQVPAFLKEHKIPAGSLSLIGIMDRFNAQLKQRFGKDSLIVNMYNYQVHLNHPVIDLNSLNKSAIKQWIIDSLKSTQGISQVIDMQEFGNAVLNNHVKNMLANGYFPQRSGDLQILLNPHWIEGGLVGTTHGLWNPYDSHIPLLWYGWNIKPGKTMRDISMTDIAPTLAAILKIQMPSGSVGKVIEEVMR